MELKKQLELLGEQAKNEKWHVYKYLDGVAALIDQRFAEIEQLIKDFEERHADKT